ncbi:MAG: biliverdin-producing heme oxygenase [Methyloligella sp. ZOD6]
MQHATEPFEESRSKRLKSATQDAHHQLDRAIMEAALFSSRDRYVLFLEIQHRFHRDIDALYRHESLRQWLPDLAQRQRLSTVEQDMRDLGLAALTVEPLFGDGIDFPAALGWLYVAEGSKLGAAFLLKAAARIGLGEDFGARHLAGAPEGRGLSWRRFIDALDSVPLHPGEEKKLIEAALSAFAHVDSLAKEIVGRGASQTEAVLVS